MKKRGAKPAAGGQQRRTGLRGEVAPERRYVPLEEGAPLAGDAAAAPDLQTESQGPRPTMAEIFGPGGLLERCLPDSYEHRRSQLEMAELLSEAFEKRQHVQIGRAHV